MHHPVRRFRFRHLLGGLFLSSLITCLWLGHVQPPAFSTTPPSQEQPSALPAAQVQQGVDRYQTGDYRGAIASWQAALTQYRQQGDRPNTALVLENLARGYQQLGQSDQAITYWGEVIALYRQLGDSAQVGRALAEQAQAYSRIGQPRKAIALLCNPDQIGNCANNSAFKLAEGAKNPAIKVAVLGSLGDAYRLIGEYDLATQNLQQGLKLAEATAPDYRLALLNSLGNVTVNQALIHYQRAESAQKSGDKDEVKLFSQKGHDFDEQALSYLEQSLALAHNQNDPQAQLRSLLSAIPAYYRTNNLSQATDSRQQAIRLLEQLPDSRDRVFTAIHLVRLLHSSTFGATSFRVQCLATEQLPQAVTLLQQAVATAQRLQDARATSFALGELGHLYECQRAYKPATDLTQQARLAAEQDLASKDSLYLWEWQTGRILKAPDNPDQDLNAAIAAYQRAIATLEPIRGDILTANRDIQFDFRDTIEPIYRELVELKLNQQQPVQATNQSLNKEDKPAQSNQQKNFRSILRTIDSLKLAELQNYFGNDCVIAAASQESLDLARKESGAVFSTIILENRTAVLVSLPNGEEKFTWIDLKRQDLIDQVNNFRIGLERFWDDAYNPKLAQEIYKEVVGPFEEKLQETHVKTLVFVQDGIFRSVPMAALHDGTQFLIQKYAIATTPSLTLTDPKQLNRNNLRVLALGLTKAATVDNESFRALPEVSKEIDGIKQSIPNSKKLLDEDFTRNRMRQELSQTVYPIIHVATHGKFGADPKDTFIVTGDAPGNVSGKDQQKLTLSDLDQLIRNASRNTEPLELISLTACETAVGNDRSALGLAGAAVQAGARSALASLWNVNDATTAELSKAFYAQLRNPNLSKSDALQDVQKSFIEGKVAIEGRPYTHPAYWAPFVLIGNWL